MAELLKIEGSELDTEVDMSEYGFDSITLTEFANQINQEYGIELMPTIFFEHSTLDFFSKYLSKTYPKILSLKYKISGENNTALVKQETPEDKIDNTIKTISQQNRLSHINHQQSDTMLNKPEPVAIIGLSDRFPGSPDIDTFWKNLKDNRDLITEIPADRWDWQEYWRDASKEKNKTKAKWGGFINDIDKFDPLLKIVVIKMLVLKMVRLVKFYLVFILLKKI